jgi:CHAT domain-containing protein/tetratricopeptide (TPR) repeat protein
MAAMGEAFENEEPTRRGAFISWRWLAIASFLIIALPVGILIANKLRGSDVDRGTRALIGAFSKQRLIEPRLSGGFKGGEFRSSTEVPSEIDVRQFERARELITDSVAKDEASARLAYARLLLSRGEKLPEALKLLRRAPESAEAHNDLGVCLIQQDKLEDAIEEFEKSLKQQADMPEALFNRALCYQRLLLRDAASTDLSRLLEIERDPSWRNEIEQRHQEVSGPLAPQQKEAEIVEALHATLARHDTDEAKRIVDLNFEVTVKHFLLQASVEYLKEAVAGKTEQADRVLSELKWIGKHAESHGDRCVSDIAAYLNKLQQEGLQAEFRLVSEYLDTERVLVGSKRYSEAQAAFKRLSEQFALRGNYLFQHLSDTYLANCLYADGSLLASLKPLRKAIAFAEARQWPYMRAYLLCQLSGTYSRLDQDSLAIQDCERAKQYGHGMPLVQAKASQYLGNAYWRLGNLEKALSELRESTSLYLASVPTSSELANNYLQIADIYRLSGNHRLGLVFAKQALDLSDLAKDYRRAAQASSFLAVEHARLGLSERAEEHLKLAFDNIKEIKQDRSAYTEVLVLSRAGEVAATHGDTEAAVQYYSKAEKLIGEGEEKTIPLLTVLRGRAEAYVRAKRFDEARADLERALLKIEGYRTGIADSQNRSSFLDASQGVFDQMILLDIDVFHRKPEAFELSEESRARVLLDQLSFAGSGAQQDPLRAARRVAAGSFPLSTQAKLPSLAKVQASLPEGLRLLSYSVTNEHTYLFLITRKGIEVAESPATTEMLDRLVHDYVSVLRNPDAFEEVSEQGRKLYQYLIGPIEGTLSDGKALCIVPDKALHFLPFAALVDGSGRYFVESHRLTYAPSASVLVRSIEEARAKGLSKEENIVAVGNPRFNRTEFPLLKSLPDAEREAQESAAPYTRRSVLIGPQASESEVRAQLKTCDVAHLAVHCLVAEKSPWLAALVLAGQASEGRGSEPVSKPLVVGAQSSPEDGLLYLNEIYGISLPRARLVVLSACETGLGQYYRGEGIVSLIRPFLAARVPTVVASLWSVDSRATAELMIQFHQERRANNIGAGDALQAAQIKMIRSAEYQHPYYWAPFISVGAN